MSLPILFLALPAAAVTYFDGGYAAAPPAVVRTSPDQNAEVEPTWDADGVELLSVRFAAAVSLAAVSAFRILRSARAQALLRVLRVRLLG